MNSYVFKSNKKLSRDPIIYSITTPIQESLSINENCQMSIYCLLFSKPVQLHSNIQYSSM